MRSLPDPELALAVASLGDRHACKERLDEIERVLKFDPLHPDRRQLVNEYLNLTEPRHVQHRA